MVANILKSYIVTSEWLTVKQNLEKCIILNDKPVRLDFLLLSRIPAIQGVKKWLKLKLRPFSPLGWPLRNWLWNSKISLNQLSTTFIIVIFVFRQWLAWNLGFNWHEIFSPVLRYFLQKLASQDKTVCWNCFVFSLRPLTSMLYHISKALVLIIRNEAFRTWKSWPEKMKKFAWNFANITP